jgi:hypothetical protein
LCLDANADATSTAYVLAEVLSCRKNGLCLDDQPPHPPTSPISIVISGGTGLALLLEGKGERSAAYLSFQKAIARRAGIELYAM